MPRAVIGVAVAGSLALLAAGCTPRTQGDALRDRIARWSAVVAADTSGHPTAREVRSMAGPVIARAESALARDRRHLALFEVSRAWPLLSAARYVVDRQDSVGTIDALEAEWNRLDATLEHESTSLAGRPLSRIRAALAGALAEAALPQVRVYHHASLEYGRSTQPGDGLFYMGEALAQEEFVAWCAGLGERPAGREPPFRAITAELAALESEILGAYRPPASIDLHPGFITAASALKEARELEVLGLRRGALLRYLQGSLRAQPLTAAPPVFDAAATPARLDSLEQRFRRGLDHGIGRLFLELARTDLEDTTSGATHAVAAAVAQVVLPRYFAALQPAVPLPAAPVAEVTVTLVRWPYT
jgi:hypothetical protein